MNSVVFLAAMNEGGPIESITRTFGVDWSHLTAQIISFCIVCALLYRFAYRPVLKMLEERRRQISQGLANTEKIKAELARTEAQCHEMLVEANSQAANLIDEARSAAARLLEQETQKAIDAAQQIVSKSREAAAQDYTRMLAELKQHVGDMVVQTTAMVIHKALTAEDQRRLLEETSRQLSVPQAPGGTKAASGATQ